MLGVDSDWLRLIILCGKYYKGLVVNKSHGNRHDSFTPCSKQAWRDLANLFQSIRIVHKSKNWASGGVSAGWDLALWLDS